MTPRNLTLALMLAVAPVPVPVLAQDAAPAEMAIGYLDLAEDPRYDLTLARFLVPARPWGRSIDGAQLGIVDAEQIGRVINVDFTLREASGDSVESLADTVGGWVEEGVHFVVADLPADMLVALADAVEGQPVTLFNVSAEQDSLRAEQCRFNVVHTIPSYRMMTDAVVQYLVSKRWTNILVLQGPLADDAAIADAVRESAGFFGANIVDVRPFVLGADPRMREQNNVALMTEGGNYDAVFVADSSGEFAHDVPYHTNLPRPVVGGAGLVGEAWHWAWWRQGAPQVNARFEAMADRYMHRFDWAAWAAVRAVTQSVLRSESTEYEPVRDYLLGERMNLDGSKGNPMSVRPWDHQLRQGMLLAAGNVVVELAPIEGFLHETNDLDTLGVDEPRSQCQF
ncbi:ABC transporter substrate-binding protein [Pelagibacterium lacus]|uniref:Amino acid ABC transporter substrate-binding protein n=1 Tax=Pelagibacterium lacus TaxID=2282655 RepID=A0A369WAT9_9HYPH|nr:ABC transporter substrate-binding protein [Pelagibacterium lacus]RDE09191.1 amino acid ABC transporter substrate-binding protein [Pelagibacterium lacus]